MQLKSWSVHALGSLSGLSRYADKLLERSCKIQSGNEANQLFLMLVLALFVIVSLAWPPCLHSSVNRLANFHVIWAMGCLPFGLLVNHSPSFQAVSQFSNHSPWLLNGKTSLCIIESGPTSLKTGWPVACLQSGQFVVVMILLTKLTLYPPMTLKSVIWVSIWPVIPNDVMSTYLLLVVSLRR